MENNFATALMNEAIDLSFSSVEADHKVNETDEMVIVKFFPRRHHTVKERRKWNAKAKAYRMPECGLWPSKIRELKALKEPGADELVEDSKKDVNHDRHTIRADGVRSREEARRMRHPKANLDAIIDEFEVDQLVKSGMLELEESFDIFDPEPLNYVEYLQRKEDPYSLDDDLSSCDAEGQSLHDWEVPKEEYGPRVYSKDDSSAEDDFAVWDEMHDLISRGDLYFPPQGGMFVASNRAFEFICQHQEEVLALIS